MKKKVGIIMLVALCAFLMPVFVFAADAPVYDSTFNNGEGAFFANGTPITIAENKDGNTTVTWNGGSQIVPNTVTVFGGGSNGQKYQDSNITMDSGTVKDIYGGGMGLSEENATTVENSNITINGGVVTDDVAGGGLLYSTVNNANVTMNNGQVGSILGGGLASAVVNGVYYQSGTEDDVQNSGTQTENADIVINNGTIKYADDNYGLVYGGGQGYSYTGNVDLTINDGDLYDATVTAGGSNGYTDNVNVEINGGNIGEYQSVNRGTVNEAQVTIKGGNIQELNIAGEDAEDVTGTLNSVTAKLNGGRIKNLNPGISDSREIIIDNDKYKVNKNSQVRIINDNVGVIDNNNGAVIVMWLIVILLAALDIALLYIIFSRLFEEE